MGSLKITVCAGAAVVAAVLVPAGHASGDGGRDTAGRGGGGGVSVTPARPSPGSEVTLKATGCRGRTATAASAAFVADARLVVADDAGGALVGDTRVRSSLAAGGYDVRITCEGGPAKGGKTRSRIEVQKPVAGARAGAGAAADAGAGAGAGTGAARDSDAPSARPVPPASPFPAGPPAPLAASVIPAPPAPTAPPSSPVVSASPVAPVRAGGGGAAPPASVEEVRVDGRGPGTVQAVVGLVLAGVAAAVVAFRGLRRRPGAD
ncbi:hypothetical protein OG802_13210 [Streptomyces sp. NBC_00704]|uniref:hypothetical protein n=1 Tax=Streptomyces sp. NBC_00704 TaxID=2975809 RepID=UPI002E326BD9|nr:hypothetical protein [Streptomyces sp. NBC_00704]